MIFLKALTAVRAYFFYHKARYHALSSDFVNVNKFEATRMVTGSFQQKDPSWCAVVVKP